MKRLIMLLLGLTLSIFYVKNSYAQGLNGNEWINLANTYKKIKIAQNGVYRITAGELDSLGFSNVPGNQFALFRDGKEVPIYVSTQGVFSANDFILFYGTKANGAVNTALYPDPSFQPDTLVNLISDSVTYFLTYDNTAHQRLTLVNNTIPNPTPTPAAFCYSTILPTNNPKVYDNKGMNHDNTGSEIFLSSTFDFGEGYSYTSSTTKNAILSFPTENRYTAGANPILNFVLGTNTYDNTTTHNVSVRIGNTIFFDTTYTGYQYIRKSIGVNKNLFPTSNTAIRFVDNNRMAIYAAYLKYQRTFNFSGSFTNQASFELPAGGRCMEITNFNAGTAGAPLLFDLTNNKIYKGTLSGSTLAFYLDNDTGARQLFLTNASSITNLDSFASVTFRNYSLSANQGNYIILTNKAYSTASPNYVQEYANYRSSAAGGGYSPVIVNVENLYDQFGYGYDFDPLSIRRFLQYALNTWQTKPKFLFIIGKGTVYYNYQNYLNNYSSYGFPLVPTWGDPGSDNLLSAFGSSQTPTLATGRLSIYSNQEIGDYLAKVQAYETAMKPAAIPTPESELWKKKALHIAGAGDINLQTFLKTALNNCAITYQDTLIGGIVRAIAKNSTDPVENIDDASIDSLINNGLNIITFFGHASSSGFDYNLNDPDLYHSSPRFPVFFAYGCDISQIFDLTNQKTISEQYIHSASGGSVAMVAEDNFGYTATLQQYMQEFYKSFCYRNYGKTLGEQYQLNIAHLLSSSPDDLMKIHAQCLLLQGDPALSIYNPSKPDFAVTQEGLSTNPANISTTLDSFELKIAVYNLGEAYKDTVLLTVSHTHAGNNTVTFADTIPIVNLLNIDTIKVKIPIDPIKDVGLNNYSIYIDPQNKINEISEQNNQTTLQLFIYENSLVPVYPTKFSIVHQQGVILKASTLDAFAPVGKYKFEIDTTAKFNSPLMQSTEITSGGGVLKWKPNLQLQDSVVYYWRTAPDSLINGQMKWAQSSFVYLANGSDGWNQSHFFQFLNDNMIALDLPEGTRKLAFTPVSNQLFLRNKVISPALGDYINVSQSINDIILQDIGCIYTGSVHIMVIDKVSGLPWVNSTQGKYGAAPICSSSEHDKYSFEFPTNTFAGRDSAIKMIERVPDGDYIAIYNFIYGGPPGGRWDRVTANDFKADTAILGPGNSLYNTIKNLGFTDIDQFDSKKPFIFFRKKNDNNYPVYQVVAPDSTSAISVAANYNSYPDSGRVNSTTIGPSLQWQHLYWQNDPTVSDPDDHTYLEIYGITNLGQQTKLYSGQSKDMSLAFINAQDYPNINLVWHTSDTANRTSANMKYWRVLYKPVPEAALNAAAHLSIIDSLNSGQAQKLQVAIENLTPYPMDSMLVKYKVIDAQSVAHPLIEKRYKKLLGNDTLIATLNFNSDQYPGKDFLYIEANPDNDQPEQYHPNNIGFLPYTMNADKVNPLLDVTFDGIHILDKDIVSAKPLIKILLKDNNKYALLTDTSLINVQLLYPNAATPVNIPFDGKTCVFYPANNNQNEARVEFRPDLTADGVYKLIVTGKDKSGNVAGGTGSSYEVQFTVENKPSITNVLNYPNPFSTSTQFLFTLTGSEIPSQFKIQILSVTGKVVREITKDELGPLHIGRNITEYHWDGRDQNGQLLGNGVYLYRVVTSLDGNAIDHRYDATVDKFFKNGYGKLYIMR